jgi:phage terminase large subunit-like protein
MEADHGAEQRAQLRGLIEAIRMRLLHARLSDYAPYPKQASFHAAGALYRERLLMAANQVGKTVAGAAEASFHLTGQYPAWWRGRRWTRPVVGWAAGVTSESTRDNVQRLLLGRPGQHGTGYIPKALILDAPPARGVADLCDHIKVRHVSGGDSMVYLKSYGKGRAKWQGETLDFLWGDEEPPADIWAEGLVRIQASGGLAWITFTPLLGATEVVTRFLIEQNPGRHVTQMTIEDAAHYSAAERAQIVASFADHEREARAYGIPTMGSGRVFPVLEEALRCDAFQVPPHFALLGAMDFGWDHPFAAVKLAFDRDEDCLYVTNCYRVREQTPVVHAAALRPWGSRLKWAWPHDGLQHDKGSGDTLAAQYRAQGLRMMAGHASHASGGFGLEAGVMAMLDRMKTGRLKVFSHLSDWFEEFRLYHRRDGLIVKERDDLLSATRVGLMMLRHAVSPEGEASAPIMADGYYDPLDGAPQRREGRYGGPGRTVEDTGWDPLA